MKGKPIERQAGGPEAPASSSSWHSQHVGYHG
jgi:hypothetical protein